VLAWELYILVALSAGAIAGFAAAMLVL